MTTLIVLTHLFTVCLICLVAVTILVMVAEGIHDRRKKR